MQLQLPDYVRECLQTLEKNGFEAYCVGGCIRDLLRGEEPKDYDITTNATGQDILRIFDRTVPTGLRYGTVTVLLDESSLEVTTFRQDGEYFDGRHPDSVKFSRSLEDDLSRRDFTINAMAYSDARGVIDLFGGISDLHKRVIRTVGSPQKRFSEDALRIMRAFRFASQLNFNMDKKTLTSALEMSRNLSAISCERLTEETVKELMGQKPSAIFPLLAAGGLQHLGMEKPNDQMIRLLDKMPKVEEIRLAALLLSCKVKVNYTIEKLRLSKKMKRQTMSCYQFLCSEYPATKSEIKMVLKDVNLNNLTDIFVAKEKLKRKDYSQQREWLREIMQNKEPYRVSDLAITGDDLLKLGVPAGKQVGRLLDMLLELCIQEPEKNHLEYLQKYLLEKQEITKEMSGT